MKTQHVFLIADAVFQWLFSSVSVSLQSIWSNCSPKGSFPGTLIAGEPEYRYMWTRDAALAIPELYQNKTFVWNYILLSRLHQLSPGCSEFKVEQCEAKGGPGEPKFTVDGNVFYGSWGRPQNDGPALRAIALMEFALNLTISERHLLYQPILPAHSIIKTDLEYIAKMHDFVCFDLWEEVTGYHFFTRMMTYKALKMGESFAMSMNDVGASLYYKETAQKLHVALKDHLVNDWIQEHLETSAQRTLDIASLLAVLLSNDIHPDFTLASESVIRTYYELDLAFGQLYPLNQDKNQWEGNALGRYPEDTFDGNTTQGKGNPWFLATFAGAEYLYRLSNVWKRDKKITITNKSLVYLQSLGLSIQEAKIISFNDSLFPMIIQKTIQKADAHVYQVMKYAKFPLSEQFDRTTGALVSAKNLVWSHVALLRTFRAKSAL